MGISVVIPNYNGGKYIEGCLESLKRQTLEPDEIIIVDNASSDRSLDIIQGKYNNYVKLIKMQSNKGFSIAVNEGIKKSIHKYVVLLNNDTEVEEDWLKELHNEIKKDEDIFSVCSKMLRFDNRDIVDDVGDGYTVLGWATKRGDGKPEKKYTESCEVFSSCAGAAIYRRDIFEKIGYFDENFFAYLEDIDISYRAKIYGFKNYFAAGARVYHIGSATSGSRHNAFKVKLSARNNIFLIHKNMTSLQKVINLIPLVFGIVIKQIYFQKRGLGKAHLQGIKEGFKEKKKIRKINLKNNFHNYIKIELELIKNTIYLFKERINK